MLSYGNGKNYGFSAPDPIFGKAVIMKSTTIKTEWASLSLAEDGNVIVCAKSNGTPHCVRFDSLEQLKQAIDKKKISVKKWAVAIPRSSCILKPLTLPASDLAEAEKMIEFELSSLVPLPVDEIVYGSTLLNKQDSMLNILVCILKLNTLNEHLKPYRAIGIEPHRITLNSLAIQSWFNSAGTVTTEPVISILISKNNCTVQTGMNGNFHKANELTLIDGDITAFLHEIVQEILHQREELPTSLKNIPVFFLGGTEEYVSEIKNLFCSVLREPTVVNKVSIVPNPRILYRTGNGKSENDDDRFGCEAIVAAGLLELAANSKLPHSNLLPQQYARRHTQKALLFRYLLTGSLSLVLVLLVWICLVAMNWRIERMSRVIESQIAPIERTAGTVDSKRQRVKAIQRQLSNRGQIVAIIDELYRYTPKAISISELKFISKPSGASIEIKGQADLLSTAFDYTDAVRKAELLSGIQILNAQQIPRPSGSVVVFKAYCDIQND